MTSRDVVNVVQRRLPRKTKVGHAGTLDPLAEGVLVGEVAPPAADEEDQNDREGQDGDGGTDAGDGSGTSATIAITTAAAAARPSVGGIGRGDEGIGGSEDAAARTINLGEGGRAVASIIVGVGAVTTINGDGAVAHDTPLDEDGDGDGIGPELVLDHAAGDEAEDVLGLGLDDVGGGVGAEVQGQAAVHVVALGRDAEVVLIAVCVLWRYRGKVREGRVRYYCSDWNRKAPGWRAYPRDAESLLVETNTMNPNQSIH